MWASDHAVLLPNLPSLSKKVGKREAFSCAVLPNLPNLPNLFQDSRTRAHARTRAYVCVKNKKYLGKVGKVGNKQQRRGFWLPNLNSEVGKVGKWGKS